MKPIKIIICDDDTALQAILRRKIESFCSELGDGCPDCQIACCSSGEELLRAEQTPDIVFLDIRMPGTNGMETARKLRRRHKDMVLVFVTALSEYVYEAFDVGAFHYLVKPFGDDKLKEVLGRAVEQCIEMRRIETGRGEARRAEAVQDGQARQSEGQNVIVVKRGGVSTRVLLSDIIYAEVFNRKVMLHTTGGNIEYYGKLTELSEQAGEDFYRTHRAYLVNLNYVEKYNATTIWLEGGVALVSKKQFAGFVRRYMQYINRKRGG